MSNLDSLAGALRTIHDDWERLDWFDQAIEGLQTFGSLTDAQEDAVRTAAQDIRSLALRAVALDGVARAVPTDRREAIMDEALACIAAEPDAEERGHALTCIAPVMRGLRETPLYRRIRMIIDTLPLDVAADFQLDNLYD